MKIGNRITTSAGDSGWITKIMKKECICFIPEKGCTMPVKADNITVKDTFELPSAELLDVQLSDLLGQGIEPELIFSISSKTQKLKPILYENQVCGTISNGMGGFNLIDEDMKAIKMGGKYLSATMQAVVIMRIKYLHKYGKEERETLILKTMADRKEKALSKLRALKSDLRGFMNDHERFLPDYDKSKETGIGSGIINILTINEKEKYGDKYEEWFGLKQSAAIMAQKRFQESENQIESLFELVYAGKIHDVLLNLEIEEPYLSKALLMEAKDYQSMQGVVGVFNANELKAAETEDSLDMERIYANIVVQNQYYG